MRKYLQITIVLGIFGLLVWIRQVKGNDLPVVVGNQNNNNPTSSQSNPSASQTPQSASPTQQPTNSSSQPMMQQAPAQKMMGLYKNGTYTGSVQDAFYGNIQVQAVISGGKITDVVFLQYPNDNRTSQFVNSQADPMLKQEAIQVQSAQVDIISGASASSQAFQASLADALSQAR
jgi:uncharacterized protein with FMN-binding domain